MAASDTQAVVAVGTVQSALPAPQLNVVETHTKAIGLIMPPPDVRAVIDKTANFVATHGTDFEKKILAQPKNVKFNFLEEDDPYHKYYKYKILEQQEGEEAAKAAFARNTDSIAHSVAAPAPQEEAAPPTQELRKPDDEKYTAHIPAGLTFQDLDIIKLTAQFVARNGTDFLNGLKSREEGKKDFPFLRENHSLNTFFKRLTDAYSAVLLDSKEAVKQLMVDAEDEDAVLQRCLQRLEWNRVKETEADEARAERERERLAMMMVDWHDFAVVRTIEFDPEEDVTALDRPVTRQQVMQMNRIAKGQEDEAIDVEAVAQDGGKAAAPQLDVEEAALIAAGQVPGPAVPDSAAGAVVIADEDDADAETIKVVKDYVRQRPSKGYDPSQYVTSPITGELVPIGEMQEHMRISLLDPKWKEQKEAMFAKIKETTKATDTEIMANLTRLATTRPDVFGSTDSVRSAMEQPAPSALPRDGPAAPRGGGAAAPAKPALAPLPAAPAGVASALPPPPRSTGAAAPPLPPGAPVPPGPPSGAPPGPPPVRPPGAPPPPAPLPLPPDPKRQRTS